MVGLQDIAEALKRLADESCSVNELDSNGEPANVVDGLFAIARAITRLSVAVERVAAAAEKAQ